MSGDELRVKAAVLVPLERDPKLAHLVPTFTMIVRNRDWTGEGQNGKGRQRIKGWCVVSRAWVAEHRNISQQTAGKHIAQLLELGFLTLWRDSNSQHGCSREFLVTALAEPEMLAVAERRAEQRAERRAEAAAQRERLATEGPREVQRDAKGHFRRSDCSTRPTPAVEVGAVETVWRGRMDTTPTSVSYLCELNLCEEENGRVVPTSEPVAFDVERDPRHAKAYRVRIFNALDHHTLEDMPKWTVGGLLAIAWLIGADSGSGNRDQRTHAQIAQIARIGLTANQTYDELLDSLYDCGDGYDGTERRRSLLQIANATDQWTPVTLAEFVA